jgi:hypothetical protein
MCEFIRRAEPASDQVCLEIKASGGKLSAKLKPPDLAPQMMCFDEVPLLRAVKMAKLMADYLGTGVVIVDPLGIWHDWLVEWACRPAGEGDHATPAFRLHRVVDAVAIHAPSH